VFVTGDSIVYSASDLAAAARCEYALLRDFDAKLGWAPPSALTTSCSRERPFASV
jgi:predicted RecB family nuclease